jgi:acyl-CoA reductase-like NAD-dependent aldehyde dehydrogenase
MPCEGIEASSVCLDDIQHSSRYLPFDGMKESDPGRENGRYGIESYLAYKRRCLSYEVSQ